MWENGGDYAERLMDDQYGRGSWEKNDPEYRQLKKYGDRNFRDFLPISPHDDDHSI
jgi:hypothetical protein